MTTWEFILNELNKNNNVVLLTILEANGSSPGKVGFKMVVSESLNLYGSVGGGSAEYKAVENAKDILKEKQFTPYIQNQIHSEEQDGMICSGNQIIAYIPILTKHLQQIEEIVEYESSKKKGYIAITNLGLQFIKDKHKKESPLTSLLSDSDWMYCENISINPRLYIFGGGHVSLELSKIMKLLKFDIIVYDNREDLNTMSSNTFADKKVIIDYKNAKEYLDYNFDKYVVIMTYAHNNDYTVLRNVLNLDLKYLGLMGSKSKVGKVREMLSKEGFSDKVISKIHMPIGIPIKNITPTEIAISIAAQIIDTKNS